MAKRSLPRASHVPGGPPTADSSQDFNGPRLATEVVRSYANRTAISKSKVTYLSGLPCAGKSTVAAALASRLGATVLPEFLDPLPNWVVNVRPSHPPEYSTRAQLWTLAQHIRKNKILRRTPGLVAVVDRTWLDSLIYSLVLGESTTRAVIEIIQYQDWLRGLHVVLVADPRILWLRSARRNYPRNRSSADSWQAFLVDLYQATMALTSDASITVIDTSHSGITAVADKIAELSREHFSAIEKGSGPK